MIRASCINIMQSIKYSTLFTGAARVNLTLARSKNSSIVHLAPTDHVVIRACTVNVHLIATEESLRSPEEAVGT